MPRLRANRILAAAAVLVAACGAPDGETDEAAAARPPLGLFATLPIYWNEGADIAAMLEPEAQHPNWVRETLEAGAELVPLDTLEAESLAGLDYLLLAQPRALAASENVALDTWVRAGGHVLVLADPFLTQHSEFALGDPRRPFDVVLISPILSRWGLELQFDDRQSREERLVEIDGTTVPVQLAGRFAILPEGEDTSCTLSGEGLMADCRVGAGRAILLADAALVDTESDSPGRRAAFDFLLARLRAR